MKHYYWASLMLAFSSSVFAQNITPSSLDTLVMVNKANFCYQLNDEQKGFKKFYQLPEQDGKYLFLGIPVLSLGYAKPVLEITQTASEIEKMVNKNIKPNELKFANIYTITHEINFQLSRPPLEVLNTVYRKVPGLVFNTEQYGGGYVFAKNEALDISHAKTAKEIQSLIDAQSSSAFSFKLTPSNGGTLVNYKCEIKIKTNKRPEEVAIDLVD